ncbi:non-hydrolyzing UDP-N-acetylglucosamine 2-epimerase [Candidatus Dependentiae bacterium]
MVNCKDTNPIVLIVGTRPEGIKVIPVYKALKKAGLPAILCSTMQHDELLSQVFDIFAVKPDINLDIMRHGQDLFYVTQSILQKTKEVFLRVKPSLVIVQGDTTSTMAAALAAFYAHIPVAHVEAGLRTGDMHHPFPEEANRKIVSQIATYHFCPTETAVDNLLQENIKRDRVFCTGNTVVDALRIIQEKIESGDVVIREDIKNFVQKNKNEGKKIALLTTHRRESFNGGIEKIINAVKSFLNEHNNVACFYPFHPNPHVISAIEKIDIGDLENLYICEPVPYSQMVYLLSQADLVLTDSGGIQEEAVALGKNVLVLREKTERIEGVKAGLAKMVGTDENEIKKGMYEIINNLPEGDKNIKPKEGKTYGGIYGDGYASEKITEIVKQNIQTYKASVKTNVCVKEDCNISETLQKGIGNLEMKKVCVLGLGYIGLPTAVILAENGFDVTGFDIDEKRVNCINDGDPVIEEPEIYEKLNIALHYKKFRASVKCCKADFFIIAVPTPFKEDKKADLSYVKKAALFISKVLEKGNIILLESTVPVGATTKLAGLIAEKTKLIAGKDFYVAHCPERVLPGNICKELVENDRVVGGINPESAYKASLLYDTFVTGEIHLTDDKTAEIVKLIENSSRDAQIAFAHQVASMAQAAKLNPYEIIELANKHPRVQILNPTCGVGGHCIAIDPWFLVESFPNNCQFIRAARETNDKRPKEVIKKIQKQIKKWHIANNNKQCNVLVLGLTYKPDVDDLRESPAIHIAKDMQHIENINLAIAEPNIKQQKLLSLFPKHAISVQEGLNNADIIVFLVSHKRFKAIDKKILKQKVVLDFCGIQYKSKKDNKKSSIHGMLDFFISNSSHSISYHQDNQGDIR